MFDIKNSEVVIGITVLFNYVMRLLLYIMDLVIQYIPDVLSKLTLSINYFSTYDYTSFENPNFQNILLVLVGCWILYILTITIMRCFFRICKLY
jgi:hypothetical protein